MCKGSGSNADVVSVPLPDNRTAARPTIIESGEGLGVPNTSKSNFLPATANWLLCSITAGQPPSNMLPTCSIALGMQSQGVTSCVPSQSNSNLNFSLIVPGTEAP